MTIGVLKNLMLDFGTGKVMVQLQVLAHTNFDLLLESPFHCLMSTTTEDFPDGSQLIILHDPNSGKQITLPMCPWLEGCLCCCEKKSYISHQSIIKMGF